MKGLKKLIALATLPAMLLTFAACTQTGGGGNNGGGYKDTIDRPEIETPEVPPQVVYPEKPAEKPAAPAEGVKPYISAVTATEADSPYKIDSGSGKLTVSYRDITNWSYVYFEVANYSSAYGNVKITLNNNGAERLAIQAVYYEAYDLGYTPVTVYLKELTQGEQYAIFELHESLITDANFNKLQGQTVKDQTVLGFVMFIDSLPSYAPENDASGDLDIISFEFLADGDPALEDRYVKPIADFAGATAEGVTLTKGEKLTLSGSGSAYIPVDKYSADYARYAVTLNGAAGTQVDLAVQYTLGRTSAVSTAKRVTLTGADETIEYGYEDLRPTEGGDDLTTQYVKNGTVTAVVISPVGGEVEVSEVAFVRTAVEGAYVSDSWSSPSSNVSIARSAIGGNAKLEYYFYTTWDNFSVSVKNGSNVKGLRFEIYAPDGLTHLGIGLTNNSSRASDGQNAGQFILRGSATLFAGADTVLSGVDGKLNGTNLEGITESISYNEATKVYVITYDFTGMTENKFEDYTISSLIFYLNCPDSGATQTAHKFDDAHSLYFLSINLL